MRCGERNVAEHAVSLFAPWATNTENTAWLALLARCRGLLAATDEEADKHFGDALRLHLAGESEFDQARTELLYGQELRARPPAQRGPGASAPCAGGVPAARGSAVGGAGRGRAARRRRPRGAPAGVGGRRVDPAAAADRPAGRGRSDQPRGGEALFLSTRTVDHHMRNIFARLGIRSRVDLAKLMN